MAGFSIEATRPTDADIAALSVLARGTQIYVSAVPNRPAEESISAAVRLRAAGFEPVPHIAVRNFASADALDDFLARLQGEAEVRRALVIAGDRSECGPFKRAHDAIDCGVFRRRGIRSIGIAGYPDGHPRIGPDELRPRAGGEDRRRGGDRACGRDRDAILFRRAHHPRLCGAAARLRLRPSGAGRACRTGEPVLALALRQPLRRARFGAGARPARRLDPAGVRDGRAGRSHSQPCRCRARANVSACISSRSAASAGPRAGRGRWPMGGSRSRAIADFVSYRRSGKARLCPQRCGAGYAVRGPRAR